MLKRALRGAYLSVMLLWLLRNAFLGSAIDGALVSNILNATLPCGTTGKPVITFWTAGGLSTAGGMKLRLTSTDSTESAAGTTLTGTGYADYVMTTSSTASSAGSSVTLPAVSGGTSWVNGSGSSWTIHSCEIQDNANARAWFGLFTGSPVTVANGNTFAVAQNAVSVALT
jgi:hypothetical protein